MTGNPQKLARPQWAVTCLLAFCWLGLLSSAWALPQRFGDLDQDGQPTVLDVVRLINHLHNLQPLRSDFVPFADVNQDGAVTDADLDALVQAVLGLAPLPPVLDTDGDGLPDVLEPLLGLNPALKDTDSNGVPDGDEDFDHDGLSNADEIRRGTNPLDPDTDHDGWLDGAEVDASMDPDPPRPPISDPLDPKSRPPSYGVAQPLISVALSGPGGSGPVVAQPLVTVVLPGAGENTNALAGPVVAQPLVMVVLPGAGEGTNALVGPVVAQPLVKVTWETATNELAPMFKPAPGTGSYPKPILSK